AWDSAEVLFLVDGRFTDSAFTASPTERCRHYFTRIIPSGILPSGDACIIPKQPIIFQTDDVFPKGGNPRQLPNGHREKSRSAGKAIGSR
ncbi:MAG: hypothetical protein ACK5PZ_14650, partial [Pirellula sp.]